MVISAESATSESPLVEAGNGTPREMTITVRHEESFPAEDPVNASVRLRPIWSIHASSVGQVQQKRISGLEAWRDKKI